MKNMPVTLTDLLIEKRKQEEKYFRDYLRWARIIKKEAKALLGDVRVFVFGSAVRGEIEPGSDIDVLLISPGLKSFSLKNKTRTKIFEKIGSDSPFEVHLITPEDYQSWYIHFIKEKIEI